MTIMEADLHQLKINDPFLGQYQRLVRDVVIPYQWDALNDRVAEAEPSHAIANFRIAAGLEQGEFYGSKPWRGRCARSRMPNWKKPPTR